MRALGWVIGESAIHAILVIVSSTECECRVEQKLRCGIAHIQLITHQPHVGKEPIDDVG